MIKIGSLVTRTSHNNDIIFRVVDKKDDILILKGEVIRLCADSKEDDLVEYDVRDKVTYTLPYLKKDKELMKGKILHIDGDEYYLKKAMQAYKQYEIEAYGYFVNERDLPNIIIELIKRHNPDIVVITGHDSLKNKDNIYDVNSYLNSIYFIETCKVIRKEYPSKDQLVVVAGACQSYFEELIKEGANFASSPLRKNIHLFDPIIIASIVAYSPSSMYVDVKKVIEKTISSSIGGIDSKGMARRIYK